uniref:Gnk2-homologous domain-containing protein n=1 Tax=Ananas comosus var. bracteatus TaxID=296719 RepID=A0A6V7PZX6_ANACO|nr:unnamed protein product [Ananas comosus var. bracteatus]
MKSVIQIYCVYVVRKQLFEECIGTVNEDAQFEVRIVLILSGGSDYLRYHDDKVIRAELADEGNLSFAHVYIPWFIFCDLFNARKPHKDATMLRNWRQAQARTSSSVRAQKLRLPLDKEAGANSQEASLQAHTVAEHYIVSGTIDDGLLVLLLFSSARIHHNFMCLYVAFPACITREPHAPVDPANLTFDAVSESEVEGSTTIQELPARKSEEKERSAEAFVLIITEVTSLSVLSWVPVTASDPQTNLLNVGCSQYNATPAAAFLSALNATLSDLRSAVSGGGGANSSGEFATASRPRAAAPVYALAQCRPYLSPGDCAACVGAAAARLSGCGAANGARAIYDGCFLRYESAPFFDQATLPGSVGICGNRSAAAPGFATAAEGLVRDLAAAAPRIPGFAAAAERGGVYGAAQCVETVGEGGCAQCLQVALGNIQGCPPRPMGEPSMPGASCGTPTPPSSRQIRPSISPPS